MFQLGNSKREKAILLIEAKPHVLKILFKEKHGFEIATFFDTLDTSTFLLKNQKMLSRMAIVVMKPLHNWPASVENV